MLEKQDYTVPWTNWLTKYTRWYWAVSILAVSFCRRGRCCWVKTPRADLPCPMGGRLGSWAVQRAKLSDGGGAPRVPPQNGGQPRRGGAQTSTQSEVFDNCYWSDDWTRYRLKNWLFIVVRDVVYKYIIIKTIAKTTKLAKTHIWQWTWKNTIDNTRALKNRLILGEN